MKFKIILFLIMSLYIYGDVEEKKIKLLSDNIELSWVFNERERTDDYCNRITTTDVFAKIKSDSEKDIKLFLGSYGGAFELVTDENVSYKIPKNTITGCKSWELGQGNEIFIVRDKNKLDVFIREIDEEREEKDNKKLKLINSIEISSKISIKIGKMEKKYGESEDIKEIREIYEKVNKNNKIVKKENKNMIVYYENRKVRKIEIKEEKKYSEFLFNNDGVIVFAMKIDNKEEERYYYKKYYKDKTTTLIRYIDMKGKIYSDDFSEEINNKADKVIFEANKLKEEIME